MGPALKLKVSFRSCRRGSESGESRATEPSSLARQIALAHFIEERIESGELASYAEAAERLGLTRARLSQVVDRILLAPTIQEAVLLGSPRVTERGARAACAEHAWGAQVERVLATQEGAVGGGDRPAARCPGSAAMRAERLCGKALRGTSGGAEFSRRRLGHVAREQRGPAGMVGHDHGRRDLDHRGG
jgi:hypothetical protein